MISLVQLLLDITSSPQVRITHEEKVTSDEIVNRTSEGGKHTEVIILHNKNYHQQSKNNSLPLILLLKKLPIFARSHIFDTAVSIIQVSSSISK